MGYKKSGWSFRKTFPPLQQCQFCGSVGGGAAKSVWVCQTSYHPLWLWVFLCYCFFCFVFLFMYFSFSSELLFDSTGYGSLPACMTVSTACMTVSTACLHDRFHCLPACTWPFCLLPHMAATIGISALLSFPGPPCVLAP